LDLEGDGDLCGYLKTFTLNLNLDEEFDSFLNFATSQSISEPTNEVFAILDHVGQCRLDYVVFSFISFIHPSPSCEVVYPRANPLN
jgi:hypothetical protein